MKIKWKKAVVLVFGIVMIVTIVLSAVGCSGYRDEDVGDFNVRFYNNEYAAILGTTEQGNYKRHLVIPEYIQGMRVWYLGEYWPAAGFRSLDVLEPDIKSDVIEKVYFENEMTEFPSSFGGCSNLTKTIFVKGELHFLIKSHIQKYYLPYKRYISTYDAAPNEMLYWHTAPANISYCYNYEGAENDGYHWIDDCEYGEKIEFVPKVPKRYGYNFTGWYKEAECTTKWNYAIDRLPELQTKLNDNGEERPIYQETILYAGWEVIE